MLARTNALSPLLLRVAAAMIVSADFENDPTITPWEPLLRRHLEHRAGAARGELDAGLIDGDAVRGERPTEARERPARAAPPSPVWLAQRRVRVSRRRRATRGPRCSRPDSWERRCWPAAAR